MRKENLEILKNLYGKRFYGTIYFPTLPLSNGDTYILTENSDSLTSIANKFWGDVNLWWIIPVINPDIRKDSFKLDPNIQLRIPDLQEFTDAFQLINS
jgi:hypothetical protein